MKTYSLLKILKNDYISLIILLSLCYVVSYTTFASISRVNYIMILYLFYMDRINEDTIVQFSIIFGIFYDFLIDSMIGINVLFFIFLSLIKFRFDILISANSVLVKVGRALGALIIFNMYNIFVIGLVSNDYILVLTTFVVRDFIIYLIIHYIAELMDVV